MSVEVSYYFRAGATTGGAFSGRLNATSEAEVADMLRRRGFVPLRIAQTPIHDSWLHREIAFGGGKRLSLAECERVTRELAMLLRSGITIAEALNIMVATLRGRLSGFATTVRNGLQLGRSLADAVAGAGKVLPPDFIPVLAAGEASGSPEKALSMLAQSYGDRNRFARVYASALAYPALLLCVSVLVLGLIAFFVAPTLAGLFVSMDKPAPPVIAALSGAAGYVGANWLSLAAAIGFGAIALLVAASRRDVRSVALHTLRRLPFVGVTMKWSATGRFAATLGLGLANGVPMAVALPNALVSADDHLTSRSHQLIERVRAGEPLSNCLASADLMPAGALHLLAIGERSGRLVEVLDSMVVEVRARFEQRMGLVTALLAPVLILVMGSLVGTVIFSVFSALLDVNEIAF